MLFQEQIKKRVVPFGNGSIVYTPKNWIGREVIITLPKRSLKEEIMEVIEPHLQDIQGVYLYGSYARKENEQESDVDLLIISDKKFDIKKENYEILVISHEKIKGQIQNNPPFYLIIKESIPIINKSLLDEIKKIKPNKRKIKWLIDDTKSILKINEGILELEDNEKDFNPLIYSLILRLRLMYMIDCILKNKINTTKEFRLYAKNKGVKNILTMHNIYRNVRDNKKIKCPIEKQEVKELLEIVKNETEKKSKEIN